MREFITLTLSLSRREWGLPDSHLPRLRRQLRRARWAFSALGGAASAGGSAGANTAWS